MGSEGVSFVYKARDPDERHHCLVPDGGRGDLWRCDDCHDYWQNGMWGWKRRGPFWVWWTKNEFRIAAGYFALCVVYALWEFSHGNSTSGWMVLIIASGPMLFSDSTYRKALKNE